MEITDEAGNRLILTKEFTLEGKEDGEEGSPGARTLLPVSIILILLILTFTLAVLLQRKRVMELTEGVESKEEAPVLILNEDLYRIPKS